MKRLLTIAAFILLTGVLAAPVLARGPGWGWGGHMMYGPGGGPGYGPYNRGYTDTLTAEQRDQIEALYKKFYDETSQLRNELWTKHNELRETLNATEPDVEKAKALQKEISDLQSTLAQKRIDLEVQESKIAPDTQYSRGYGRGFGGHMMGRGYGMGHGWNRGGYGPGSCWD
jgi:zinc resistance-associated protein